VFRHVLGSPLVQALCAAQTHDVLARKGLTASTFSWQVGKVPLSSRMVYRLKDIAVNLAARFVTLSPRNPALAKMNYWLSVSGWK